MKRNGRKPDIESWLAYTASLGLLAWGQVLILGGSSPALGLSLTLLGLGLGWTAWAEFSLISWLEAGLIHLSKPSGPVKPKPSAKPLSPKKRVPSQALRHGEGWVLEIPREILLGALVLMVAAFEASYFLVTSRTLSFWTGFACCALLAGLICFLAFGLFPKPKPRVTIRLPKPKAGPMVLAVSGVLIALSANVLYARQDMWYWGALNAAGLSMILLSFPARLWNGHPAEEPRPTLAETLGWSPRVRVLIRWGVFAAAVFAAWSARGKIPVGTWTGIVFYGGLALAALWSFPRSGFPTLQSLRGFLASRTGPGPTSMVMRILEAAALGGVGWMAYKGQTAFSAQNVALGLKWMGLAVGVSILAFPDDGSFEKKRRWPKILDWTLLAGIMALAFWWRWVRLADHPFGFENDESGAIIWALDILYDKTAKLTAYGHYLMMAWLQAAMIHLRGGLDRVGARVPAVLIGVLTIPAFFLLLRVQFNRRIALVGAFLLAVSRWHLAYSRSAHWIIMLPLFQILCFYWLLRGLKTGRRWSVILSALALSLTMVTHLAARLVPPMLVIYLIYKVIMVRGYLIPRWKAAVTLLVASWILSMPYGIVWIKNPKMLFNPRIGEVSIAATAPAGKVVAETMESVKRSVLMFNVQGDLRQRNNGGLSGETQVDFWTGLLFALGLGYGIFHWKKDRNFLMLTWLGLTLCASIFAVESPQAYRSFGNVPAALYFSCLALRNLWGSFLRVFSVRLEVLFAAFFIWIAVKGEGRSPMGIARKNYDRYFNAVLGGMDETATGAGEYAGSVIKDHEVVLLTAYYYTYHPPFRIWVYNHEPKNCSFLAQASPYTGETDKGVAFITSINYGAMADTIKDVFYPGAKIEQFDHPHYSRIHRSVLVSAQEVQELRGLTLRQFRGGKSLGESRLLSLDGVESPFLPEADSAEIVGSLFSEEHHGRVVGVRTDGEVRIQVASCPPITVKAGESFASLPLGWGLHPVKIQWKRAGASQGRLQLFTHAAGGHRLSYPPGWLFRIGEHHGLVGRYFSSGDWTGPPQQTFVDPIVLVYWLTSPMPTPFTARWDGWVQAPVDGPYSFRFQSSGYGKVVVDSRTSFERGLVSASVNKGTGPEALHLKAGWHRITAYWRSYYGPDLELRWTPPGETEQVIPGIRLRPDYSVLGVPGEGMP